MKGRTWQSKFHFHPLVFSLVISIQAKVNICRLNSWVKKGQLLELVLNETNKGLVGLKVDGLNLYLLKRDTLEIRDSKNASRIKW